MAHHVDKLLLSAAGFMKRKDLSNSECLTSVEGLSDEQVEQFREAFMFMDKDADGYISCKELGTILRVLGQNPTETELQVSLGEGRRFLRT